MFFLKQVANIILDISKLLPGLHVIIDVIKVNNIKTNLREIRWGCGLDRSGVTS